MRFAILISATVPSVLVMSVQVSHGPALGPFSQPRIADAWKVGGDQTPRMVAELVIDLAVKVGVVVLSIYPLIRRSASHFQGKAMGVRALIYPAGTLLIPAVWLAADRPEPYPFLADIALGLPFLLDVIGNVFGLFAIPRFDALPHTFGWLFLTMAFGLAIAPMVDARWVAFGLSLGFGAVADILWEIGEFALMRSGASGLQLTYENTIQDLGLSLTGAAIGALLVATVLWPPPGTPATLFGWS